MSAAPFTAEEQLGEQVVLALHRVVRNSASASEDRQTQLREIEAAARAVAEYGRRTGRNPKLFFGESAVWVGGRLLRGGRAVYQAALELGALLAPLAIDEIAIGYDVPVQDLVTFQGALAEAFRGGRSPAEVRYARIRLRRGHKLEGGEDLARLYAYAVVAMRRFLETLRRGELTLPPRLRRLAQRLGALAAVDHAPFCALLAVRSGGADHATRAVHAALLAAAMARQLTTDPCTLSRLTLAALTHDAARARLAGPAQPNEAPALLPPLDPGHIAAEVVAELPLDAVIAQSGLGGTSERLMFHAVVGYEATHLVHGAIVGPAYGGQQAASLEARIVSAARRFVDQLADGDASSLDEALAVLSYDAREGVDLALVRLLSGAIGLHPVGTMVQLASGECARVLQNNVDPAHFGRPLVELALDAAGAPLQPQQVDLAQLYLQGRDVPIVRQLGSAPEPAAEPEPEPEPAPPAPVFEGPPMPLSYAEAAPRFDGSVTQPRTAAARADLEPNSLAGFEAAFDAVLGSDEPVASAPQPPASRPEAPPAPISSAALDVDDLSWGVGVGAPEPQATADASDADGDELVLPPDLLSDGAVESAPPEEEPDEDEGATSIFGGAAAMMRAAPRAKAAPPAAAPPAPEPPAPAPKAPLAMSPRRTIMGTAARAPAAEQAPAPRAPMAMPPVRARAPEPPPRPPEPAPEPPRPAPSPVPAAPEPPADPLRAQLEGRKPTAQGALEKTPFVHLLVYLLDQTLSGTVVLVEPDQALHAMYVVEGVPNKVCTAGMVWPLDRVLLEMGLSDEATLQDSLRVISRSKQLHGRYLIEKGVLDVQSVLAALSWQLVRKVTHLLQLPAQTKYLYFANVNLLESYGGPELTPADPLALIMAGVRMRVRDPLVEQTLSRLGNLRLSLHPKAEVSRLALKEHEQRVIELIQAKPMTLAELCGHRVAEEAVVRLTVYALAITRSINLGGKSKLPVGAAPSTGNTSPGMQVPPAVSSASRRTALGVGIPREGSSPVPPASASPPATPAPPATAAPGASAPPRRGTRTGNPPQRAVISGPPRRQSNTGRNQETTAPRPPGAGGRGPSREEVAALAQKIDDQNYFEILGVAQDATADAVQSAYFALAKTWHPDRLSAELADQKATVAKVFSRFNDAYQTLSDAKKREEYVKLLKTGGGTARDREILERAVDSALLFQKAEVMFKKGSLGNAEALVQQAIQADPDQPEYPTLLAWIQSQRLGAPPEDDSKSGFYKDQIAMLDSVLEREPEYERALFYRAELLKRSGFLEKSMRDYRQVMKLNPRNIDAAREVRLYDKRKQKDAPGGLLGRLLGGDKRKE